MTLLENSDSSLSREAKLVWTRGNAADQLQQQEHQFRELIDRSECGLVVDCSGVETGSSELIHLLMRIRKYAKEQNKQFVLFHVPKSLRVLIRICNLRLALPSAKHKSAAEKLIAKLARGKGGVRGWFSFAVAAS